MNSKAFACCIFFLYGLAVQAVPEVDTRIEPLKAEVIKWGNTLKVNSLKCQYKFIYECTRKGCTGEVEAHYEDMVYFRYQHPNQYMRIERISPKEGHYTHQEVAVYDGEISKRFDFNGEYLGGFVKSPEMKDAEFFSLIMRPTEFFQSKETIYPPMEEFFSNGTSSVSERDGLLVLSHQPEVPSQRSIDFYFDDKKRLQRMEFSIRPPFHADRLFPDPAILHKVWDADLFDLRNLHYTVEFGGYTEEHGVLFPIQINMKYWDNDHVREHDLALSAANSSDANEKARALCELYRLPKKVGLEYKISVEQVAMNQPMGQSDFLVAFPAGAYVADWSVPENRNHYSPPKPPPSPFQIRMTAENLSAIAAFISVALAVGGFVVWLQRRKAPAGK